MLPDKVLSTIMLGRPIIGARSNMGTDILNYEDGGIALNDASEGHKYQKWTGKLVGDDIILSSPTTADTTIYTASGITEFSFTFDQNMNPVIAFVQNGVAKLRWYDATVGTQVVTEIGANTITPKVLYDDKRLLEDSTSDVILAYILRRIENNVVHGDLYFRAQRDRFLISYLLEENVDEKLLNIGMGDNLRVVFVTGGYLDPVIPTAKWSGRPYPVDMVEEVDSNGIEIIDGSKYTFIQQYQEYTIRSEELNEEYEAVTSNNPELVVGILRVMPNYTMEAEGVKSNNPELVVGILHVMPKYTMEAEGVKSNNPTLISGILDIGLVYVMKVEGVKSNNPTLISGTLIVS